MAIEDFTTITIRKDILLRIDRLFNKTNDGFNSRNKIIEKGITLLELQQEKKNGG